MAETTLKDFVRAALQSGATREQTTSILKQAGWPADQIDDALAQYADLAFPIPVPRPRQQVSAREAFLYLVMFSMLYVSVYNLGNLLFQFVNLAWPDLVLDYYGRASQLGSIRFSTSALLIAYPLFLLLALQINRQLVLNPALRLSAVRRWLTYLTLTVAACVIAGDLVYLVYSLLSGELSLRFVLKVAIVAALAGSTFGYYFWLGANDERELGK